MILKSKREKNRAHLACLRDKLRSFSQLSRFLWSVHMRFFCPSGRSANKCHSVINRTKFLFSSKSFIYQCWCVVDMLFITSNHTFLLTQLTWLMHCLLILTWLTHYWLTSLCNWLTLWFITCYLSLINHSFHKYINLAICERTPHTFYFLTVTTIS